MQIATIIDTVHKMVDFFVINFTEIRKALDLLNPGNSILKKESPHKPAKIASARVPLFLICLGSEPTPASFRCFRSRTFHSSGIHILERCSRATRTIDLVVIVVIIVLAVFLIVVLDVQCHKNFRAIPVVCDVFPIFKGIVKC